MGIDDREIWERLGLDPVQTPGGEQLLLYQMLLEGLQEQDWKEVET